MNSYQLKNQQILIIREGELQDAEAALAYLKRVGDETDLLTFCGADIKRSVAEQRELIRDHRAAVNETFLVATIDDKIVGMLSVLASKRPRLQHVGEFGISVQKSDWNKGIAKRLLQEMLAWAQSNPIIRKINLRVLKHNTSAIGLYEKMGFKKEGVLIRDFHLNGQFHDCQLMGLNID